MGDGMFIFKYLFIFAFFSVVGWFLELIYRSYKSKKIINPGFMNGCVVPLYGCGAVIMTVVCKLTNNLVLLFFVAMFLLTTLEFVTGIFLEKLFHLKLWDYTRYKLNYRGLICVRFAIIWGLFALIYKVFIYEFLIGLSNTVYDSKIYLFLLGIYTGIFLVDLGATINLLNRITKYAESIKQIVNFAKLKMDVSKKLNGRKILNAIVPNVFANSFLKDKIRGVKNKK